MIEVQEELLDTYAEELSIAASSYEMMGQLLDIEFIKKRIKLLGVSELYVYGGGYLGIQLYRTVSKIISIPAVIDIKGKLSINIPDIPVVDVVEFKRIYKGQKVIIASINFYNEIKKDISAFVPESQIIFLGEFLGGILR